MKHEFRIIVLLVAFYMVAQVVGLGLVYTDAKVESSVTETGQVVVTVSHPETVLGARPDVYNFDAVLLVITSVIIGTGLVMVIVKLNKVSVWKGLFFFAVFSSITIAIGVLTNLYVALLAGLALTLLKFWKRNLVVHNATEVLIYSGIAVLFAPLFEPIWVILLLLAISGYDMFAVWKSKHMVKMAEFQIKADVFAGLSIPYRSKAGEHEPHKKHGRVVKEVRQAILGGGDVAFPMIFAASVMESLFRLGFLGPIVFFKALAIPLVTAISLLGLLVYGKKGHYYPAMPFLTVGCLVGYGVLLFL